MTEPADPYSAPDAALLDESEQRRLQEGIEPIPDWRAAEMEKEFKSQNRKSLGLGLLGIGIQFVGGPFALLGTIVLIVALSYYAKMRGRSGWWGAAGLLSILGFFLLYFLSKNCAWCEETNSHRADTCQRCGAPLSP